MNLGLIGPRGGACRLAVLVLLVAMAWCAASSHAAKFEIVVLPDTENYIDVPDGFPGIMEAQTQWIVEQRQAENIVFVSQLGDLIHHDPVAEMPEALRTIGILDGQVPYSVSAGNHELESDTSRQLFGDNFGPTRYAPYENDWYGGSYNTFNHYQVFSAEDYDFLHINLRKDPDSATRAWAQGVINANLGKPTILSTHDYLTTDTTRSGTGNAIWNDLVKGNPQIFMTLSGHIHVPEGAAHMLSDNSAGKPVLQILADFEDYTTTPSGNTDTGYLSKVIFDTDGNTISVQTYSPTYLAVPWLTDGDHQYSFRAEFLPQADGVASSPINIVSKPYTQITGRHVFYNNSAFDGKSTGPDAADELAVATDKVALRPGDPQATFDNYTSYSRGINGIIIEMDYLPGGVTPDSSDFEFKIGNDDTPGDWDEAPMPEISFDQREGDTDRVTLIWDDYQIRNTWLEVTVLAAGLGMDENDVFYFGNAVGEACHSGENAEVNDVDVLLAQDNPHDFFDPAEVTCPYDYNRDGRVNATDMLISRSNPTDSSTALSLITVPEIEGTAHLAAVPEPGTLAMLAAAAVVVLVADRRRRNRK